MIVWLNSDVGEFKHIKLPPSNCFIRPTPTPPHTPHNQPRQPTQPTPSSGHDQQGRSGLARGCLGLRLRDDGESRRVVRCLCALSRISENEFKIRSAGSLRLVFEYHHPCCLACVLSAGVSCCAACVTLSYPEPMPSEPGRWLGARSLYIVCACLLNSLVTMFVSPCIFF